MIIDFSSLTIVDDGNDKAIMFIGHNNRDSSVNYYDNPESLLEFKDGYVKMYSCFTYQNKTEKVIYGNMHRAVSDGGFVGDVFANEIPEQEVSFENVLDKHDVEALDWLVHLLSSFRNRTVLNSVYSDSITSTATSNSITNNQYKFGVKEFSYMQSGFIYRVVDILHLKILQNLGIDYDKEFIIDHFDQVLLRSQMPWINEIVDKDNFIKLNGLMSKLSYAEFLLGNNLQKSISDFFKEYEIPENKRLKRIVFSKLITKEKSVQKMDLNSLNNLGNPILKEKHKKYTPVSMDDKYKTFNVEANVLSTDFLKDLIWLNQCLPIDAVSDIIEEKPYYERFDVHEDPSTWKFLNLLSLPKKKRIIKESLKGHYFRDTVRQWNEYNDVEKIPPKLKSKYVNGITIPKFQTLKELHDKISKQYQEIKAEEKNKPIKYTEEELKLDNAKLDDITIKLPHEGSVVVGWGKELSHCIASYIKRAANKEIMLLGVYVKDEIKYNIEMRYFDGEEVYGYGVGSKGKSIKEMKNPRLRILQMRGLRNCSPEPEHKKTVEEILDNWLASNLKTDRIDQTKQKDYAQAQ